MRARRIGVALASALVLSASEALGGPALAQTPAGAARDWKQEFEEICAGTQDAMSIPLPELKRLVARCDVLLPRLEKLDEPQRKVYTRRLAACRDLYRFVLESREQEKGG